MNISKQTQIIESAPPPPSCNKITNLCVTEDNDEPKQSKSKTLKGLKRPDTEPGWSKLSVRRKWCCGSRAEWISRETKGHGSVSHFTFEGWQTRSPPPSPTHPSNPKYLMERVASASICSNFWAAFRRCSRQTPDYDVMLKECLKRARDKGPESPPRVRKSWWCKEKAAKISCMERLRGHRAQAPKLEIQLFRLFWGKSCS